MEGGGREEEVSSALHCIAVCVRGSVGVSEGCSTASIATERAGTRQVRVLLSPSLPCFVSSALLYCDRQ